LLPGPRLRNVALESSNATRTESTTVMTTDGILQRRIAPPTTRNRDLAIFTVCLGVATKATTAVTAHGGAKEPAN